MEGGKEGGRKKDRGREGWRGMEEREVYMYIYVRFAGYINHTYTCT